jgi:hypothetical protein
MRVITPTELDYLHTEGQYSVLYLAGLETPPIVLAAQMATGTATTDRVASIEYNSVSEGAYTDVVPGMTMWIGTAAGLRDVGEVRVRGISATTIDIGETSDISWSSGAHLTIRDEMLLWPKHVRISGIKPYMDFDVDYVDQHLTFDPVPIMGSDMVVDLGTTGTATITFPECVDSYAFDSTIASYAFSSTAGTWTNPNTSGASLSITSRPSTGIIRVKLTVTSVAGASYSGYRYIHVYNATRKAYTDFTVSDISGDYQGGGWSFDVTLVGDASTIRDRSKVILYAKDYYGHTNISLGQVEGRENIVCVGYVDSESLEVDTESSSVKFTVKPASFWLDKMAGFPPGVVLKGTPTSWVEIKGLTVDRAVWHLLHWRSTTTQVMDVRLTGDTRFAAGFVVPTQSIWSQVKEIASTSVLAVPGTNRNGQMFLEIDSQLVPEAERTWATIMQIQKRDWHDKLTMLCNCDVTEVAMMASSGVSVNASGVGTPYFSLAPGHVFKHFGAPEIVDRLLLSTQAQSNELAGLLAGAKNNKFPSFDINFAANNRFIDVFPRSFLSINIDETDTIRGRAYNGNLIPRTLSLDFTNGTLLMSGNFEGESFPELNVNGDPPIDTTECGKTDCPKGYELNAKGCCERIINGGCGQTTCPTGYHLNEKGCCVIDIDGGGGGETAGASTVALLCRPNFTGQAAGLVYTNNLDAYNPEDVIWYNYYEGLTYEQASVATDLHITPDGHVYLISINTLSPYIAVAESLGSPFTILVDMDWLKAEFGTPPPGTLHINAFGINQNSPNEYAFIAGLSKWPGTAGVYKFYDNSLSGSAITAPGKNNFGFGTIVYQDGWITCISRSDGGLGDPGVIYLFKNNYETPTNTLVDPTGGYGGLWQLKNGQLLWKAAPLGTKTYITTGTDIGVWWDFNIAPYQIGSPTPVSMALASSPSGLVMMATGTPTGLTQGFWISFDGGTTWTVMPGGIPDYQHAIANGYSDQIWIASEILTNVYLSKDAGVTWENRSNTNMASLLWLSNVYKIVVVQNEANP